MVVAAQAIADNRPRRIHDFAKHRGQTCERYALVVFHGASPLEILHEGDAITLDAISSGCRSRSITYYKRDFILRSGAWRGKKIKPLVTQPWLVRNHTVVVGHSDYSLGKAHQAFLLALRAKAIFAVNTVPLYDRVSSLPLGLTNATQESTSHEILGNHLHLISSYELSEEPQAYTGTIYANFTDNTNTREREGLRRLIHGVRGFVSEEPQISNAGRVRYLAMLRGSDFVLCPEGNGIDTHRLWETLYMGGIPIIKSNPAMASLLADLPVLVVNSWSEVLMNDYLEMSWHRIRDQEWDSDKLRASHWIERINRTQSEK